MIEISTDGEFDYQPEPLFTIGDQVYECPTRFPAGVGIAYLDLINRVGAEGATTWLLRRALGDEAFAELVMSEHVTEDVVAAISEAVVNRVRYKGPKSPATSGSRNGASPKGTSNGAKRSSGSRSASKKSART